MARAEQLLPRAVDDTRDQELTWTQIGELLNTTATDRQMSTCQLTCVGVSRFPVSPVPSWPSRPSPQHHSVPPARIAAAKP